MVNPLKSWKNEYTKSSRSTCKTYKKAIDKDVLRIHMGMQLALQLDLFKLSSMALTIYISVFDRISLKMFKVAWKEVKYPHIFVLRFVDES